MNSYRTLGRTGLRVSPLALGAMTFGWGAKKATARQLFDTYRSAGGNFIDTADMYAGGASEEWLGEMICATNSREEIVLATKFSFNTQPGNPNAGGNGRKNILRALAAAALELPDEAIRALDEISAPEPNELDHFFGDVMQDMLRGGMRITRTFP